MEKIIKEFVCVTKIEKNETIQIFRAIDKCSIDATFKIHVSASQFERGKIKSHCETEIYFNNKEEMIESFKFHYNLSKDNLLTYYIKVTK